MRPVPCRPECFDVTQCQYLLYDEVWQKQHVIISNEQHHVNFFCEVLVSEFERHISRQYLTPVGNLQSQKRLTIHYLHCTLDDQIGTLPFGSSQSRSTLDCRVSLSTPVWLFISAVEWMWSSYRKIEQDQDYQDQDYHELQPITYHLSLYKTRTLQRRHHTLFQLHQERHLAYRYKLAVLSCREL